MGNKGNLKKLNYLPFKLLIPVFSFLFLISNFGFRIFLFCISLDLQTCDLAIFPYIGPFAFRSEESKLISF